MLAEHFTNWARSLASVTVCYFILNESSIVLGLKTAAKTSTDECSAFPGLRLYEERQTHSSL